MYNKLAGSNKETKFWDEERVMGALEKQKQEGRGRCCYLNVTCKSTLDSLVNKIMSDMLRL